MNRVDETFIINLCELNTESVLAVLSALQAFEKNSIEKFCSINRIQLGTENYSAHLLIVREEKYAHFDVLWTKCLRNVRVILPTLTAAYEDLKAQGLSVTSVVILEFDIAMSLAETSGKHLAQTYGLMLGSEPGALPDVSGLAPERYENIGLPLTNLSQFDVSHVKVSSETSFEDRIVECFECSCFVGYAGFESYLMSALKKPVFELSNLRSLTKWDNPNYFLYTLPFSGAIDATILAKGVEKCLSLSQRGK